MNRNLLETLTGAAVLAVATWFLLFFLNHNSGVNISNDHYILKAKFEQIDGVTIGSPVKVAGVKVGVITNQDIDPNNYLAILELSILKKIAVPQDSIAKVVSEGLIGGKYLSITPGGDEQMLKAGEEIKYTQSSVNLESLIGKMIFSDKSSNNPNPANPKPLEPTKP